MGEIVAVEWGECVFVYILQFIVCTHRKTSNIHIYVYTYIYGVFILTCIMVCVTCFELLFHAQRLFKHSCRDYILVWYIHYFQPMEFSRIIIDMEYRQFIIRFKIFFSNREIELNNLPGFLRSLPKIQTERKRRARTMCTPTNHRTSFQINVNQLYLNNKSI